jgi:general L-amino acid transport system ATP-binding protein
MSEAIKQSISDAPGIIQMDGVHKWYGQFHVLKDINLNVQQGERIVLCGPSGSGKSTAIRCLNRLEEHQQGRIVIDGTELTHDLKHIEAVRREVGMVFQHGLGASALHWRTIHYRKQEMNYRVQCR